MFLGLTLLGLMGTCTAGCTTYLFPVVFVNSYVVAIKKSENNLDLRDLLDDHPKGSLKSQWSSQQFRNLLILS